LSKQCPKCGVEPANFYAGVPSRCVECHKEAVRRNRRNNPHYQEYDRQRAKLPHRKESAAKVRKRWRAENRRAHKAHSTLNYHLRAGNIKREPCAFCGASEHIHAHHRDYDEPLNVVWLCARCYHRLHALFPELEGQNKSDA
jgi:hypothetical protein